jgi:hypothetical protein
MSIGIPKIDRRLEESEAIRILINWGKANRDHTLGPFDFIIHSPLDTDSLQSYTGYYVAQELSRSELGFDAKDKPGDFDVVIIPYSADQIFFERTAVVEVKVARPTRERPSKNANKLGISQLNGLIRDGFPLVALMHVSMTEPLKDLEKKAIKFPKQVLDIDQGLKNQPEFWNDTIDVQWDWFGLFSADKQMKRLIAEDIPKYAGLSCGCLSVYGDGDYSWGSCSQDFWHFQHGYFNPHTRPETIERVRLHFEQNPGRYEDKKR